jgi:RNA polymerase-binding transcription factor DksA
MKKTFRGANAFQSAQRAWLEDLRGHLARRTRKVESDLGRAEGAEIDSEEQAVERENDEVLTALSGEGRDQLELVEAALARLDAGTYGLCVSCGRPISRPRLEALPYATTCVACSKKLTMKG